MTGEGFEPVILVPDRTQNMASTLDKGAVTEIWFEFRFFRVIIRYFH